MAKPDFSGPLLKAERADHHIKELDRLFRIFIRDNQKAILRKCKPKAIDRTVQLGAHFPRHTVTVLGDALHNLVSALDHAYCILVQYNGDTIDRNTKFPFGGDAASIRGSINGQKQAGHGPGDKVRDEIVDVIQPYPGGNGDYLWQLKQLDIADKHTNLIPTTLTLQLQGFQLRNAQGEVAKMQGFGLVSLNPELKTLMTVGPGYYFEQTGENQSTFDILFPKGEPMEGQSILRSVRDIKVLVASALKAIYDAA